MSEAGDGEAGFTLLEMLVVLAALGLIGGLVYPAMARLGTGAQARAAADRAVLTLATARARAIRVAVPMRVEARSLPAGAAIVPASGIVFYPDGSATGGGIAIVGRRYTVAAATGLIGLAAS